MSSMKGTNILIVVCFVFFLPHTVWAATKYWIGPDSGSFGANANWSTTSGGSADTTAPGSGDVATFDGGDVDTCAIDANINVGGIDINAGYTGTIT